MPFLRIDYIWHDKNLDSMNFKTHQKEFSDHRAISVDINFNNIKVFEILLQIYIYFRNLNLSKVKPVHRLLCKRKVRTA